MYLSHDNLGYREFSSYLVEHQNLSPSVEDKSFAAAVERMKLSTGQYAKRQIKWIKNKLLPAVYSANAHSNKGQDGSGDVVPTYLLDATGMSRFQRVI